MSWAFLIDDKISLLRPHDVLAEHSYHDFCKAFAISIGERLCDVVEHDCLTVVSWGTPCFAQTIISMFGIFHSSYI